MKMAMFIFASDLERSVTFYEALGFGPAVAVHEGSGLPVHVKLRHLCLGGTGILLCTGNDAMPSASDRTAISLDMEPGENLEEYRDTCRSRGLDVSEIIHEPFGRLFWVRDPDGVSIQVNAID